MDYPADGPLALDITPAELQDRFDRMMGIPRAHPSEVIAAANGNSRPKPPTSTKGYVEDAAFDSLLADQLELVPDVAWPLSVQTYEQMRRDAKLAAILDGYSLQLMRAQWQLDGTGCRPEVVELVADDMDLPVKGQDKPGAARTKGVSWRTHLQGALTMLPFGHAGFELQAEIVDSRARLVGLWDRPQHTIEQIHVEPKTGQFNGISQELALGPFDKAEIGPERIAWYAHRREGAQWFGRSILRPSFAPWLFKREMMRVLATSSRRFGQGVPTVEWAQGSTPSPEQFSKAQEAITAARVGDTAGVTMPPGAMMRLVGLSGGTPDTLAFVKWLDQQMATSALMQHLDLGQTQTGSRALGESFIDSWTLALEAIGEEVADAATRQIAARIVGWNWGNEPVPRVVVSGIGSRREITAQSLQLILSSGALRPYPGLAEWVAREYRLPEPPRDLMVQNRAGFGEPQPEPGPAGEFGPDPAGGPGPVEAAAPARRKPPVAGQPRRYEQPELPIYAQAGDDPAGEEGDTDDDVEQARDDQSEALLALLAAWPVLAAPLVAALAAGAAGAVTAGTLGSLGSLSVPARVTRDIAAAITQAMTTLGAAAAGHARQAITRQGVEVDAPTLDPTDLRRRADATAGLIVSGYRSAAARAALAAAPDAGEQTVQDAVRQALDDLTATAQRQGRRRGFVASELDGALHAAVHWGRAAVFRALQAAGVPVVFWADESNDDPNRCEPCAEVNGRDFASLDLALAAYPWGTHRLCEGRNRCRGQLRVRIDGSDGEGVPGA